MIDRSHQPRQTIYATLSENTVMIARIPSSILAAIIVLFWAGLAAAEVPQTVTYQGFLTDSANAPIDDQLAVTFKLYDEEESGVAEWTETFPSVDFVNGRFSVDLGSQEEFGDALSRSELWLEVTIDGQTLEPRTHFNSVPYAIKADKATNAETLEGQTLAEITSGGATTAQSVSYDNSTSNLQATDVQAALDELAQLQQRIAALEGALDNGTGSLINVGDLQTDVGGLQTSVGTLQADVSQNTTDISANAAAIDADNDNTSDIVENAGRITALESALADGSGDLIDVSLLESDVTAHTTIISGHDGRIADLETLTAPITKTTLGGKDAVVFTGVNVHVRNGSGSTNASSGSPNGLGNLIIGYNEVGQNTALTRDGSHNLVVGSNHEYTSFGSVVAGLANTTSGPWSVAFGNQNSATAFAATVTAGKGNDVSGDYSTVSGGSDNKVSSVHSAISGGRFNDILSLNAPGSYSSISGGRDNETSAQYASITGGVDNTITTNGEGGSISGGTNNTVGGQTGSVSGGAQNQANGVHASVCGGSENLALGTEAAVLGGNSNEATATFSVVVGGFQNKASANEAVALAGKSNDADGVQSVVLGGSLETNSTTLQDIAPCPGTTGYCSAGPI